MASKNKKNKVSEFRKEDVLQAVVIADSFNVRFAPVTQKKPRALLPLVNLPLIDYTLEFLNNAGIQHVIVFCCIHADQIKQHLRSSRWQTGSTSMDVEVLVSEGCMSVGDALRDIDAKSLINNDFVLVNGDMVANVNLAPIIQAHKQRRLAEKAAVMTLLLKEAPPGHPTRCAEEEVLLATERHTQRVLAYHKLHQRTKFSFPLELFSGSREVELRYDLLDCHISICSPHVPSLFTDNFDYMSREHFVKGILQNEEIMGNTMHVHVLKDEYACRVSNLQMYDAVSQDVLSRWSYPMVPDKNISDSSSNRYSHGRHNIYLHRDVTLARGCELVENVIIGKDSSVGCHSRISNSVIGKNVKIGENVRLRGAYIWDDCVIEDGCDLNTCLLDTGVHLYPNVIVKPGCVLAQKVAIGPDVTLNDVTLWVAEPVVDEFSENTVELNAEEVGTEGVAYRYEAEEESDDESREVLPVWGRSDALEGEESEESDSESDESSRMDSPEPDEGQMFYDEVLGTLERAIKEDINSENIVLEVNSVKSAYGIYINEVNGLLTKALLELPCHQIGDIQTNQYMPQLKRNFNKLLPVLKNYIRSAESESNCINAIEDTCLGNAVVRACVTSTLHLLYEREVLCEDTILTWHQQRPGDQAHERAQLRTKVASFVTWLEEAEEESEDESDG